MILFSKIFNFTEAQEAERKKESQEDSVETYEAAFERIKEMTGEEDLDLLVQRFIETEDKNFALFNFVNEQNNEIETLHEQIEEVGFLVFFKNFIHFVLSFFIQFKLPTPTLPPPPNMVKELYLIKMYFRKIMKLRNSNCKALNLRTKERKFSKSWRNSNWCALKKPMNIPKRIKKYLKFLINSEQVGCKLTNLCLN